MQSIKCGLFSSMFRSDVCVCVGHNRGPTKTTEPIEMPFGAAAWTRMRPQNHALGGGPGSPGKEQFFDYLPAHIVKCISDARSILSASFGR